MLIAIGLSTFCNTKASMLARISRFALGIKPAACPGCGHAPNLLAPAQPNKRGRCAGDRSSL